MAKKKRDLRRLATLAKYLREKVKKSQWDGGCWGNTKNDQSLNEPTWSCKTKGCALGHASQVPSFKRYFELEFDYRDSDDDGKTTSYMNVRLKAEPETSNTEAGQKFFKLSDEEAVELFESVAGSASTPLQMAKSIESFVKDPTAYMERRYAKAEREGY